MPIRKVQGGYKWGDSGKVYPTREGAEKQAAAAYASGYKKMNKGGVPSGYHRMPDGSIMKNSAHDYRHGGMVLRTKDNRKSK